MSFTDNEILELNELCTAVVDETLTHDQQARLSQLLSTSLEARQYYIRAMGLSASLYSYASEMQTGAPDAVPMPATKQHWKWAMGLIALAACVVLFAWLGRARPPERVTPAVHTIEYVARLTGSKDCQWASDTPAISLGSQLPKGQRLDLLKGFAEITFDSGALVVLEGPASLDVNSAWKATLNHGNLKASLPPEAWSFSISNPTVEVVDLGTEFTMFADASGANTEVLVLKGEVEAETPADQQRIVLREKEGRLFAATGISSVRNSEQKFEKLSHIAQLDHFVSPTGYAHWSFDETEGDLFKVDTSESALDASEAQLQSIQRAAFSVAHTNGRLKGGLQFDGHLYAKAAFPSISESSPHTVLFWVKVPKDANLSNAYAMAAWGVNNKKLGLHPINIDWNRKADDGSVGVLRTDYGGGFAMGATSLRDGRWHHVAVVFIPRDDGQNPLEVKQYLDGRLEGEGRPSPPGSDIFMSPPTDDSVQTINGVVWLGCRVGIRGARADRFYGAMDELFVVDRALEPQEIVRLMNTNQLGTETTGLETKSQNAQ